MINLLKKYTQISGASGNEQAIRNAIIDEIKDFADEMKTDALGNLIVFKKGENTAKVKLMIDAHMDEVGFIIIGVTDDGYLKFETVGGIDNKVLLSRQVKIGNINGVIGGCAVHLLEKDQRKKIVKADNLVIDIGAKDKEQALKFVNIGDYAVFDTDFFQLNEKIAAKALDDRFGCAVLTKLIQSNLKYDSYFTFTVQEEVGCRGATTAAYFVEPQAAIAVEATTAADIADTSSTKRVCTQGQGAVISFMDKGTIYDRDFYNATFDVAKQNNIKVQSKTAVAGSNNSSAIHKTKGGIRTLSISLPCRYIHSGYCVADKKDMDDVLQTVKLMAEKIAANEV